MPEPVTKLRIALMSWDGPQYMLARACGVAAPRITDWQMGRKEIPTRHLLTLSRILKRNPEDLVGYADDEDYLIHPNEIISLDPFYHKNPRGWGMGRPNRPPKRTTNGQA